jgi:hypothetical protein
VARLVLVEGLPGSGKTSVAKHLSPALRSRGIAAVGIRELDPDHPVVPRSVMRLAGGDDYAERCLERWEAFVDAAPEAATIIEGCAFQSTVRFLFANGASGDEICVYWERFEKLIAPLSPRFVYLYQDDPAGFMESRTLVRRGSEWTEKVAGYAVGTEGDMDRGSFRVATLARTSDARRMALRHIGSRRDLNSQLVGLDRRVTRLGNGGSADAALDALASGLR